MPSPPSAPLTAIAWQPSTAANLERQWRLLHAPAPGEEQAGRALTHNLIVRVGHQAAAERMAARLWQIGPRHPARAFLVVPQPPEAGMRIRMAAQPRGIEALELTIAPERAASLVAPLMQSDLPTILIWYGPPPDAAPDWRAWVGLAGRVLLDAAALGMTPLQLRALADALGPEAPLSDFTWTRLTPWRQLLCQGLEALPAEARTITAVTITMAGGGPLAAALLSGWLAQQLEWQPVEAPSLPGLRLQPLDGQAAVTLNLEASAPSQPRQLLHRVRVETLPGHTVEVDHNGAHLSLQVRRQGRVIGHWAGASAPAARGETELFCEELSIYGPDPLYQRAIERGCAILARLQDQAT